MFTSKKYLVIFLSVTTFLFLFVFGFGNIEFSFKHIDETISDPPVPQSLQKDSSAKRVSTSTEIESRPLNDKQRTKNEPVTLQVDDLETANQEKQIASSMTSFILQESELYQQILQLYNDNDQPSVVRFEQEDYYAYVTPLGVDFYILDSQLLMSLPEGENFYSAAYQAQKREVESFAEWALENEHHIYRMLSQLDEPNLQLLNLICRGDLCLSQFSHPIESAKVLGRLIKFIKANRQNCGCKGVMNFSHDISESTIKFVFD